MSDLKLRIKFGEHEFEAEGTAETVEAQFIAFKQMVLPQAEGEVSLAATDDDESGPPPFDKMVRVSGRIVSLTVPAKTEDAVLLVLLAQKQFRKNDAVSGGEIMDGLRASGVRIPRADYILTRHARDGNVVMNGDGRKRRYQLTDRGAERALGIVRHLAPLVRST